MSPRQLSFKFAVFVWLVGSAPLHAGITGTIAGIIRDADNRLAIPGVNVMVVDTYLGAITDENGFYVITNVPAGPRSVRASFIGYRAVTQTGVSILPDLRTGLDFELTRSAIEMEEVVVTARSPMIRKDVTATTHFISPKEIEYMPVQTFQDIVEIQPGVAAGHIRGGRKTELLYLVDGLPIQEAIEGRAGSDLPNSSIVEMSVQTGGFNAEYGNAMSGVVNIITKEGSPTFTGMGETDLLFTHSNPKPFGDSFPGDFTGDLNVGGPTPLPGLRYFLATNFVAPNTRWKDEQFGNRLIVLNSEESYSYNVNAKATYYPLPQLKLTAQGLLSLWRWREYDHKWKLHTEGLPLRTKKSYRISLTAIHTLSPNSFYEVRLSQYNVLKSILGQSFQEAPNLTFEDFNGDGQQTLSDWQGFVVDGDLPWWMDHQENNTILKSDFTSQVTPHHQIKTGLQFEFFDLYKKNVQAKYLHTYDPKFPLFVTFDTEYEYQPWQGTLYIQDKIDYDGMVANVGLRYDYFNPTAVRPALEERTFSGHTEWIIDFDEMTPAKPKHQFSPRLGIALPVTATDVLHVNYGYFFQMPAFEYLYMNANLNTAVGFSPLGDPDLKPAKTIMWEVSYQGQLTETTMFDLTLFNKDVSNLVDANTFKNQRKEDIYRSSGFTRFVNLAMVGVRGLEFYLKRDYNQNISGKISYTYMIAKGTGSSEYEKFTWTEKNYRVPTDHYYLSWDQRHTLVANLDLRKPGWGGLNILWRWNSPLPYTYNEGRGTTPNNRRMDATTTLDVRMNKDVQLGPAAGYLYLELLNATDRRNILWVDDFGRIGGLLGDPGAVDIVRRTRFGLGLRF